MKELSALKTRQSHTITTQVTIRSFQRNAERGPENIYREEAQSSASEQPKRHEWHGAGIYGNGNAPLWVFIGLLLILNIMHNSATDRRWARLHSNTPPAKKKSPITLSNNNSVQ